MTPRADAAPPVGEWVKACRAPLGEWLTVSELPAGSYVVERACLPGDWGVSVYEPRTDRAFQARALRWLRAPWSSDLWQHDPDADYEPLLPTQRIRVLIDLDAYAADLEKRGAPSAPLPRCIVIPSQSRKSAAPSEGRGRGTSHERKEL